MCITTENNCVSIFTFGILDGGIGTDDKRDFLFLLAQRVKIVVIGKM